MREGGGVDKLAVAVDTLGGTVDTREGTPVAQGGQIIVKTRFCKTENDEKLKRNCGLVNTWRWKGERKINENEIDKLIKYKNIKEKYKMQNQMENIKTWYVLASKAAKWRLNEKFVQHFVLHSNQSS